VSTNRLQRDFGQLTIARRQTTYLRLTTVFVIAVMLHVFVDMTWVWGWAAAYVLALFFQSWVNRQATPAASWRRICRAASAFLTSAIFGALALPLFASSQRFAPTLGGMFLAGALLDVIVVNRSLRVATISAAAPLIIYLMVIPFIGRAANPNAPLANGLWFGSMLLIASVAVAGRTLWIALEAETAAKNEAERLRSEAQDLAAEAQALAIKAQAADRAKSEFLATMSHEIRTPLNAVLGMVEVMDRSPLPERQQERLAIVKSSARTLLQIINAVLDISRIESGKMELVLAPFSLTDLTDGLDHLYSGIAAEKGLSFSLIRDPALADIRYGDEVRLRQVINNLAANALKFTDKGSVTVEVGGDEAVLTVRVSDTGPGIPDALRDQVFERFAQADSSSTRRSGGSGLGLAICRELVDLMGGWIRLKPSANQTGSCFEFQVSVPVATEPANAVEASPTGDLAGEQALKVLIVDDNQTNRTVLAALLGELGITASLACDGVEAVEAFRAGPWDVILMDIHMPNMDGLQACRTIRDCEVAEDRARTPIFAVTASALAHETQQYREAGMDGCIPKPIEIRRLVTELQAVLTDSDRRAA
jgi:signal transduction histidine kinase/ActR/RegA family two-component response regulator